ncbi:ribosomal protein S5 domain 2-like protein [Amniculicola lignicola CBS 123094]|uniref:Ribosomal RNA-processing protein 43 n=1 Tax=Amniculicola lignicola CBS 123094 TaxID=1392246 RepID=A0A6A5W502_9PLEO|nr:ribosomal protein S5 domain 2-like protein [Amniculicola lignicola CBS 123094]
MATKTANAAPALSFPRPIFAALSPHPFLQAHLSSQGQAKPPRANGRTAADFRTPSIKTGALTHCHGSAVVRVGGTSVVCGVRGEILRGEDVQTADVEVSAGNGEGDDTAEISGLRLLVPNVELSTGSTPLHIPGNAPSGYAQTLVTRLRSLLLSTRLIRARDLRILYTPPGVADEMEEEDSVPEVEIKGYWVLYIDTVFISLDGNALDAAWIAILAALASTRLPKAYFDEELEIVVCSDTPSEAQKLELRGLPIPSTFAVFEGQFEQEGEEYDGEESWVLNDPDAFEESVCREMVCVVVDGSEGMNKMAVKRIEKSGGGVVGKDIMKVLVKRSAERWQIVQGVLKEVE